MQNETEQGPPGRSAAPPTAPRAAALRLAGYSFLILFIELALIRYVAAYVRVFAFFVNFVLIATFLGMGVGLLREGRRAKIGGGHRPSVPNWVPSLALLALFGTVKLFSVLSIRVPSDQNESLWNLVPPSAREIGIVPAVLVLFVLISLLFIPLGASLGREFRRFPALTAYSYDIAGSLVGVLAFGALSALHTPPLLWLSIACGGWLLISYYGPAGRQAAGRLIPGALGALALVAWTAQPGPGGREVWSPYYRITTGRLNSSIIPVNVNGMLHQYMMDLNVEKYFAEQYAAPYATVPNIDTALVIGAGTGNNVALLLKRGARYIDAVEIDPEIYAIGRAHHPMHPYADPRVHVHIDDARAFLRRSTRRYDVIAIGTLDSQTLLSGMSSVRLDNYVYTVESMESVRDHLKPDGSMIAYHMSPNDWIAAKVYQIAAKGFRQVPRGTVKYRDLFNLTVVAGAGAQGMTVDSAPPILLQGVELPQDDWPYLYLRHRTLAAHYIVALLGVLGIAALFIWFAARDDGAAAPSVSPARARDHFGRIHARDLALFSTGLGFLLLESKSVTEMSLLFGSTWTVNLMVFASILTVIGVANFVAVKLSLAALPGIFLALFAGLAVAYAVPIHALLVLPPTAQWLAGGLLVGVPVLFAALMFAILFRDHANPTRGLGYNLMGAILGGVLEYAAMVTGVKTLYLIAGAAYVVTLVAVRRLQPAAARVPLDAALRQTPAPLQA